MKLDDCVDVDVGVWVNVDVVITTDEEEAEDTDCDEEKVAEGVKLRLVEEVVNICVAVVSVGAVEPDEEGFGLGRGNVFVGRSELLLADALLGGARAATSFMGGTSCCRPRP